MIRPAPMIAAMSLAVTGPALAQVPDADHLIDVFEAVCLTAEPPALLPSPEGFVETADRETFAGPAERFWIRPGGDESVRFGLTFTTTMRACEFVVDAPALDPAQMQQFGARAILSVQALAARQGATPDVTAPEQVVTIRWLGTPEQFTAPFEHSFELFLSENQTLIRGVVEPRSP